MSKVGVGGPCASILVEEARLDRLRTPRGRDETRCTWACERGGPRSRSCSEIAVAKESRQLLCRKRVIRWPEGAAGGGEAG